MGELNREIAPGISWVNNCLPVRYQGAVYHTHISAFLIKGSERTLLVDCGNPFEWANMKPSLDEVLGGRTLDWIVPTHPEIPHAGNIARLLESYPGSRALGDLRDYHVFVPEYADRLIAWPFGKPIDLGGGYEVTLIEAPVTDLANCHWLYESSQRVLFVADAFAYVHPPNLVDAETPTHRPGECLMFSSEFPELPNPDRAMYISRPALLWLRYRPIDDLQKKISNILTKHPTDIIAPAHGNVITGNIPQMMDVVYEAYALVHQERDQELVDLRKGFV